MAVVQASFASSRAAVMAQNEAATLDTIARYVQEIDKLQFDPSGDWCMGSSVKPGDEDQDTTCDIIEWYVQDVDGLVLESPSSSVSAWSSFGEKPEAAAVIEEQQQCSDRAGWSDSCRLSLASAGVDGLWDDDFMLPPPAIDLDSEILGLFSGGGQTHYYD